MSRESGAVVKKSAGHPGLTMRKIMINVTSSRSSHLFRVNREGRCDLWLNNSHRHLVWDPLSLFFSLATQSIVEFVLWNKHQCVTFSSQNSDERAGVSCLRRFQSKTQTGSPITSALSPSLVNMDEMDDEQCWQLWVITVHSSCDKGLGVVTLCDDRSIPHPLVTNTATA